MDQKIRALRVGGQKLAEIFAKTLKVIEPGKTLFQINQVAEGLISDSGYQASFKTVKNYQWATCLNLNRGVVHGIPNNQVVKKNDLVSLDMGLICDGWHTDMAHTIEVNPATAGETTKFLQAGKKALEKAIGAAKIGNYVGDISASIQTTIEEAGYQIVTRLTGHGVGRKLHEPPNIPGILVGRKEATPRLEEGMTLAIEVIYAKGRGEIVVEPDGWTISTQDGKMAALFEKTVLIGKNKTEELTPFLFIH